MDAYNFNASGHRASGTRLRRHLSNDNSAKEACSDSYGNGRNVAGLETFGRENKGLSADAQCPQEHDHPTSPAFMRLLSQRSLKSPQSSRSPSVVSHFSSRRRVASPKITSRAWLGREEDDPPLTASADRRSSCEGDTSECALSSSVCHDHNTLRHSKSRSGGTKGLDECREPQGRSGSRCNRKSHKKQHGVHKYTQQKVGTRLCRVDDPPTRPFHSSSRPVPRHVMSPRCFPPPTFEKILLGLSDSDFTVGSQDTDVFGGRSLLLAHESGMRDEEECRSVDLRPEKTSRDLVSTLTSTSSRKPLEESLVEDGINSHGDEVIPEHYLYIPPLRVSTTGEERRLVPALRQTSQDDDQISVRGERRHIATLFSLEAAESHAQKARLQEQIQETTPFRLVEMGESPSAVGKSLDRPPGKAKRRERSTVLETIVRQHDWGLDELAGEEEGRKSNLRQGPLQEGPRTNSQSVDNAPEAQSPHEDMHGDHLGEKVGGTPPVAETQPAEEVYDISRSYESATENSELPDAGLAEDEGKISCTSPGGSVRGEAADIPGAFDAIWGHCERALENKRDTTADSTCPGEGISKRIFDAQSGAHGLDRMAEFLTVPPADNGEARKTSPHPCASAQTEGVSGPYEEDDGAEVAASTSESGGAEGTHGIVALLHLGDASEWEVRYSTSDGSLSGTEQSPVHCQKVVPAGALLDRHEVFEQMKSESEGIQEAGRNPQHEASEHLPENPLGMARVILDASEVQSRMNTYSSRKSSTEQYDTSYLAGSLSNSHSNTEFRATNEPDLGAALDSRLVSCQSSQDKEAESRWAIQRLLPAKVLNGGHSASRRRHRTLQGEGSPVTFEAGPVLAGRQDHANGVLKAPQSVYSRFSSTLTRIPGSPAIESQTRILQQREPQFCLTIEARNDIFAATKLPGKNTLLETELAGRSETVSESDAWAEGDALPPPRAKKAFDCSTHPGGETLCDIDLSEPLGIGDELSLDRSQLPAVSRPVEFVRVVNSAAGWCVYGPGVHAILLGTVLLAVWALLAICCLLDNGRGIRFFVGCAVGLSFVFSLLLGSIQLAAAQLRWKALKYAIDLDMREYLFSTLNRLRPAPDAQDPSVEGMGERDRYLRLVCRHFVELITQGSPRLEISRMIQRRFIMAYCAVGVVGGALIAALEFSIKSEDSSLLTELRPGDALSAGTAALYSILLLVLSYWLTTPPSPAVVQRTVEYHGFFQYSWVLTLTDFLVDKGAVTLKSAEDIWFQYREDTRRQSPSHTISLKNALFEDSKDMQTIGTTEIPRCLRISSMSARVVWQLPHGVSREFVRDCRAGQRVLLSLNHASLFPDGPNRSPVHVYLKLTWCGRRSVPEELRIPIDVDTLDCESTFVGKIPPRLRSHVRENQMLRTEDGETPKTPLEAIRLLLEMLQGDSTRSFSESQTCRYLCEPAPLPERLCNFPVILRIPVDIIEDSSCAACGLGLRSKWHTAASCCKLGYPHLHEQITEPAHDQAAVREGLSGHKGKAPTITTEREGVCGVTLGPWRVQPAMPSNTRSSASRTTPRSQRASKQYAYLTLLFASEEQREEFNGYLEQVLCS